MKCLRKDNPKKSLVNGNPLYNKIPHTGKLFIQGEPLVNIRENHLQRDINYTRKPLIYGNPCKVNALFNKGAHPRPSLFEESSVHLKISKTTGKTTETKTTKEVKASTIKNRRENQNNNNCQTHVGQSGHGSESLVFVLLFWFSLWLLIVFALASLVGLISVVFPMVLLCSNFCIVCLSACLETNK